MDETATVVDDAPPETAADQFVPGAELLGRGIYVKPRQPYLLRERLFSLGDKEGRTSGYASNIGKSYRVPRECAVNSSPPMPADQVLGQTLVEESWDRFGKQVALGSKAAITSDVGTLDTSVVQTASLQTDEESYYALRSSFVPLWEVYVPRRLAGETGGGIRVVEQIEGNVVAPFDPSCRSSYAVLFDTYGSHFIRRVWVGGKASLIFVVSKSSQLSKEDVKTGVQLTLAGAGSAAHSVEGSQTRDRLRRSSSCKVFGSGGDPIKLAKLENLDSESYKEWLDSVACNPEAIQLEVAGIWTLLSDRAKAEALKQAYLRESRFSALTAVVPIGRVNIFAKDYEAFDYRADAEPGVPRVYFVSYLYNRSAFTEGVADTVKEEVNRRGFSLRESDDVIAFLNRAITLGKKLDQDANLKCLVSSSETSGAPRDDATPGSAESLAEARPVESPQPLTSASALEVLAYNRRLLDRAFAMQNIPNRPARPTLGYYFPLLRQDAALEVFQRPHTAFSLYGFGEARKDEIHLFKWQQHLRLKLLDGDIVRKMDGYPRPIEVDWPQVDFVRVDAAVPVPPDRVYFFSGSEYIRVDMRNGRPAGVKRERIKRGWPGVLFDKIDTATNWGSSKIYFFYEDQYIRYDMKIGCADPGYPRFLSSDYVEDWELFD